MDRHLFPTRSILLVTSKHREMALKALQSAPIDEGKPIQFVLREQVKTRTPDQNALMWSGPLLDISEQVYVERRTYSQKIWHQYFKERYLPESHTEGITKEGYVKWAFLPNGQQRLLGSTTQLTKFGFSLYLTAIFAWGGNRGVEFRALPRQQLHDWQTEGSKLEAKRKPLYRKKGEVNV